MNNLIIIPARKNSKGIKNKNTYKVGKLSLIEFTFLQLLNLNLIVVPISNVLRTTTLT